MSQINSEISNTEVIPSVESELFQDNPDARFAVGVIAVGNCIPIGRKNEYAAHFDLRQGVYVEQTGQLSPDDLKDGVERDADDERSVVFGVVENLGNRQRLVATARLIVKGLGMTRDQAMKRPLPVEQEWPEAFARHPAPATSFEVSRLISRHESSRVQAINKVHLYAAALVFVREYNLGPGFAIVEKWFERELGHLVPTQRLGDPKYVDHYLDTNVPLAIDLDGVEANMNRANPGLLAMMPRAIGQFAYYGTTKHRAEAERTALEEIA